MRTRTARGFIPGLATCGVLLAPPVCGQYPEVSVAALAAEAHTIVRGKVEATTSDWNAGKTYIWTDVAFKVAESAKGEPLAGKVIQIRIPGGSAGGVTQRSSDQVDFAPGEEAVVFLTKTRIEGKDYHTVTRLVQGKFAVKNGKTNGRDAGAFMKEIEAMVAKPQGR